MQEQKRRTSAANVGRLLCQLARKGRLEKLRKLADASNANVTHHSITPLMSAAAAPGNRGLDCAEQLLKAGADASLVDCFGRSAMHFAAAHNNTAVVKLLHSHNATLAGLLSHCSETPLMVAAQFNKVAAVKLLIDLGVELLAQNDDGLTAADLAQQTGAWEPYDIINDTVRCMSFSQALFGIERTKKLVDSGRSRR